MTTATLSEREQELWDALTTAREALCGALRVIADIDAMNLVGMASETRQQRFVDEMHSIGIKDGFGKRIDAVIKKYKA